MRGKYVLYNLGMPSVTALLNTTKYYSCFRSISEKHDKPKRDRSVEDKVGKVAAKSKRKQQVFFWKKYYAIEWHP